MRRSRRLAVLLAVLLLSGCAWFARWKPEPAALPFPPIPAVQWSLCQPGMFCLQSADADKLDKFMDQLRAFQAARQRLLTE